MSEKKNKRKKVRNLTLTECETILFKLNNQSSSKYYRDVFNQLQRLKNKLNK